jgi:hypothetical protein
MKWVPFVLTVTVSVAAGLFAGRFWLGGPATTAATAPAGLPAIVPTTAVAVPVPSATFKAPENLAEGKRTVRQLMDLAKGRPGRLRTLATLIPVIDGWTPGQLKNAAVAFLTAPNARYGSSEEAVKELAISRLVEIDPQGAVELAKSVKGSDKSNALGMIFGTLSLTNPPLARSLLNGLTSHERKGVIGAMAVKLVEVNPSEAIALMNREKVPSGDVMWYSVYWSWSNSDPSGFAEAASALSDGPMRHQALSTAAHALARHNPEEALAWARSLPRASDSLMATGRVLEEMANRDPEAALRAVEQQPARDRRNLYQGIVDNFMMADPEKGTQWIASLTDKGLQQSLIASVSNGYTAWTRAEDVLKLVDLLPAGKARRESIANMAGNLAYRDPEKALSWLETLNPDDRQAAAERMVGSFGWSDPEKAASLAANLMPTKNAIEGISDLARGWATRDPAAALKWAAGLETEVMRKDASARVLQTWADSAPDKAAAASGEIADADTRRQSRSAIAEAWARKSPQEALEWAATLPAEDRYGALSKIWSVTAADNPAHSGEQLANALRETGGISEAANSLTASAGDVAKTWTAKNPGEAAAWAAALTEGKARDAALAGVAAQWAEADQTAASRWVQSLPAGNSRDEAVGSLVNAIAAGDPEAALQWSATVGNADKQLALMKGTLTTWKGFNPGAARQAVEAIAVPEDLRSKLFEELR